MAVTDEQVAALRAYLTARTDDESKDAERGFLTLSRTDHVDGTGDLVYGANRPPPGAGSSRPGRRPASSVSWLASAALDGQELDEVLARGRRSPTR